ncbi:MAG TPA: hypothetical protein VMI06_01905 [Terriglobia bacterium]|nr:hypothetical protein [Terriglobia bacterium]
MNPISATAGNSMMIGEKAGLGRNLRLPIKTQLEGARFVVSPYSPPGADWQTPRVPHGSKGRAVLNT